MNKLNEKLNSKESCTVQFPFKPQKIPCDDQCRFSTNSELFLWGTIVFCADDSQWYIFEFDQSIMDALEAYRFRNKSLQAIEFYLSRFEDKTIRIMIGRNNIATVKEKTEEQIFARMQDRNLHLVECCARLDNYVLSL